MDKTPTNFKPTCLHLRHKLMYVDERHQLRGLVDDSSDTRVFFCSQTGDCLGLDGEAVCPDSCCSGRSCFAGAPVASRESGD